MMTATRGQDPVFAWKVELRRLLAGEDWQEVERVGSLGGVVESWLAATQDWASAETAFRNALREIVEEWNPRSQAFENENLHLLQLLLRFKWQGAIPKVLLLLEDHLRAVSEKDEGAFSGNFISLSFQFVRDVLPQLPSTEAESFQARYKAALSAALEQEIFSEFVVRELTLTYGLDNLMEMVSAYSEESDQVVEKEKEVTYQKEQVAACVPLGG